VIAYSYTELRFRPIEQIAECMTCAELAAAAGVSKDVAMMVKRGLGILGDPAAQRLRKYLEAKGGDET
jgi:hypothetical protein